MVTFVVVSANGPAGAVTPDGRAAASRADGVTVAVTCAPRWAAKAWSKGALESTSRPAASVQAAVAASTTSAITTACTWRPDSPPRAARNAGGIALIAVPPQFPGRRRWRPGRPRSRTTRRAYLAARSGLCVTTTRVWPELLRSSSSSPISSPVAVSSAPVGSSASSSAGRFTRARAMATRWRSPPDSRAG